MWDGIKKRSCGGEENKSASKLQTGKIYSICMYISSRYLNLDYIQNFYSSIIQRQIFKRPSTKEDVEVANNQIKRCSNSSVIREVKTETTVRHHSTPTQMIKIRLICQILGKL